MSASSDVFLRRMANEGFELFRDPSVFEGNVPKTHEFVNGMPIYAACMACGGARGGKRLGKNLHTDPIWPKAE
jgi:hypothetical protein